MKSSFLTYLIIPILLNLFNSQFTSPNPYNGTTCVTFRNLRYYNYSDIFEEINYIGKVLPENYCYGVLTYNISLSSFYNINELNLSTGLNIDAFKLYRQFLNLYYLYNSTTAVGMDDSCIGYFRNVACYYYFPACVDKGDGTASENRICSSVCDRYKLRCGNFVWDHLCERNSTEVYCAGYNQSHRLKLSYLALCILLVMFYLV